MKATAMCSSAQADASDLIALLQQHREEVAEYWLGYANKPMGPPGTEMSFEERMQGARVTLDALIDTLSTGSDEKLSSLLTIFSIDLVSRGFTLEGLIRNYIPMKLAVLSMLRSHFPGDPAYVLDCIERLELSINHSIILYVEKFNVEANQRLNKQQEQLADQIKLLQEGGRTLEVQEVLQAVSKALITSLNREYFICLRMDEETRRFVEQPVCSHLPASPPFSLFSARLASVCQTSFLEAQSKSPPLVGFLDPDANHSGPSQAYNSLFIPLYIHLGLFAVVTIFRDENRGDPPFTEEDVFLSNSLARLADQALQNAYVHEHVREQAIIKERERLAQEMHDGISQVLGAINWRTATLERLLSNGEIEQATALVRELKGMAKQGYADVRESLFTLRSASHMEPDFLQSLKIYLQEYQALHGIQVQIEANKFTFPRIQVEEKLQVFRIIQEALTNIHKHARAGCVSLRFESTSDCTRIMIEDDGQGFDASRLEKSRRQNFGLAVMRERAESIGGDLRIETKPGRGTRIILSLPLANEK